MKLFISTLSSIYPYARERHSFVFFIRLLLLVCMQFIFSIQVVSAQVINIPDPALRSALELALGKQVGENITQEDMASLVVFDAFESGIRNISGLEFAVNLTALHLGLNRISDISPLKSLKKLTYLDLHRNRNISNVSPLKELTNLTWLSLRGNSILDISPLKDLVNLTYLHVAYNRIVDVSPFKSLTKLTFLDIEVNRVSDLRPLSGLTNLTYLDFDSTNISDLTPLEALTNLNELDASDNQISDISSIKYLTKLTNLDLDDNQISDISELSKLTKLRVLDLDDNQIYDISPLEDLTKLTWLDIDHSRISDVTPLRNLINLEYLDLNDNIISDVTPLRNLINLTELDLDSNEISNISSLSKLTKLTVLDLHGNIISDVTALKDMVNLTELDLDDNEIIDVTPLQYLTQLTVLDLHDNHISDFSPIAGLIGNLMDYDASGQTDPPPDLRVEPPINLADVNRDGIVNMIDLVLIATNFYDPDLEHLAKSNIFPDVNEDDTVDLIDLLIAASEMGADAVAPTLNKDSVEIYDITAKNLSQWIWRAKRLDLDDPQLQKGIAFLEQLLEVVVLGEYRPKKTALLTNYPNPFNPETWIPYQLAKPAEVNIYIYTADGKLVRRLQVGNTAVGVYLSKARAAYWDGRNSLGEAVASGIYLYTFTADNFIATGKMLMRK